MSIGRFNVIIGIESLSQKEIFNYLEKVKYSLQSIQNGHVNVDEYAEKLSKNAVHFTSYHSNQLIGLLACYFNNHQSCIAHISNLAVLREYQGFGIGSMLIDAAIKYGKTTDFREIQLEVYNNNLIALNFYKKKGFLPVKQKLSKNLLSYSLI